ncbi:MAG: hypothetical protein EZS28_022563 [Streblomastix strix]|uniref:Uncharacterized protein n=1 Tax=Streblomastix strix TaxID=222440 RepID=A0A5J4VH08_9EUKA|nr:MAG: hypothetical protein EZS28_022563 [Streblomastix strix]
MSGDLRDKGISFSTEAIRMVRQCCEAKYIQKPAGTIHAEATKCLHPTVSKKQDLKLRGYQIFTLVTVNMQIFQSDTMITGQQRQVKSGEKLQSKINKHTFKGIIGQIETEKLLLKYVSSRIIRNYKPHGFGFFNQIQLDEYLCLVWFY